MCINNPIEYEGEDPVIGYTIKRILLNGSIQSHWHSHYLDFNTESISKCYCASYSTFIVLHSCGFHGYLTLEDARMALECYAKITNTLKIVKAKFREIKDHGDDSTFFWSKGYIPKVIVAKYITPLEIVD